MQELDGKSKDIQAEKLEFLKEKFPEAFSEGKVDFAKLKAALGEDVDLGERYGLSWKGKSRVYATIQQPTTETLHPARDESVNYDDTENLFIEGDNLEALKVLQKAYYNKVKMIYIDPPYNTGNDFVYNDKFAEKQQDYAIASRAADDEGYVNETSGLRKNSKDGGHYHSNWLNMMYPRLYLARNLLRQDGVIFISIDDNEVHNLRMIMNEIFGEENFVGVIKRRAARKSANLSKQMSDVCDYCVVYSKSSQLNGLSNETVQDATRPVFNQGNSISTRIIPAGTEARCGDGAYSKGSYTGRSLEFTLLNDLEVKGSKTLKEVEVSGPWRINQDVLSKTVYVTKNFGFRRRLQDEEFDNIKIINDLVDDPKYYNEQGTEELATTFEGDKIFDSPKPTKFIERLISAPEEGDKDIVLDFFAGSGTTAVATMQLNVEVGGNRKWIMVQLPEKIDSNSETPKAGYKTIADIAKERIRRAAKKIKDEHKDATFDDGFKVLKLAPTNLKVWKTNVKNVDELEKQMQAHFDTVKTDVSKEGLLLELLLKSGYEPTAKCVEKDDYYIVGKGELIICLADEINQELFTKILAEKPQKVILLDHSLAGNDQLKTNLMLQAEKSQISVEVV